MSKEKQILRLLSEGISQRKTADMLSVSRNRVASVYAAALRSDQSFPELLRLDEPVLYQALYPEKAAEPVQFIPDYELIHKELLRSGVTLRQLNKQFGIVKVISLQAFLFSDHSIAMAPLPTLIPIHLPHIHIRMLHGMPLSGRRFIFLLLPFLANSLPVFRIHSLECRYEGFLSKSISQHRFYSSNFFLFSFNERRHLLHPLQNRIEQDTIHRQQNKQNTCLLSNYRAAPAALRIHLYLFLHTILFTTPT